MGLNGGYGLAIYGSDLVGKWVLVVCISVNGPWLFVSMVPQQQ